MNNQKPESAIEPVNFKSEADYAALAADLHKAMEGKSGDIPESVFKEVWLRVFGEEYPIIRVEQ